MTDVAERFATGVGEPGRTPARAVMFPATPSMWFFVIGDLLIFGVYFVGYMYFRGQNHDLFLSEPGSAQPGHRRHQYRRAADEFALRGTRHRGGPRRKRRRRPAAVLGSRWPSAPPSRC